MKRLKRNRATAQAVLRWSVWKETAEVFRVEQKKGVDEQQVPFLDSAKKYQILLGVDFQNSVAPL